MSDPQEPNPFAEFFDPALQGLVGPILVDDEDDGSIFDAAVAEQFEAAMTSLAEQMPEGDEEAANELMAHAVQTLMLICFRAGMLFQDRITPEQSAPPDSTAVPLGLDEDNATEIVRGLISGHGALLRLVVDRGQD